MAFAINEINKNNSLLPNISIGYVIYDSCLSSMLSMNAAMGFMNGQSMTADGDCSGQAAVQAIIGESESTPTIALTRTTGPFKIPVVRVNNCHSYLFTRYKTDDGYLILKKRFDYN